MWHLKLLLTRFVPNKLVYYFFNKQWMTIPPVLLKICICVFS